MVKELIKKGKKHFQCNECKFIYKDRKWAEKCQSWCSKNYSCNIDIIKYAVSK